MPRPFSITQIDKLGQRLRNDPVPAEEDLELLQQLRASYDAPMAIVEERLRTSLGLEPLASRLKTVGTIVEKLKRDATRLSKMQDIAGVRHVTDMTLKRQNAVVTKLIEVFPDAKVVDRRDNPNHGYRAVHVIPTVDGCPVEIQVRTHLQDLWAQIMEKLADRFGREMRYDPPEGQPPGILVTTMASVSDQIARVERPQAELEVLEEILKHAPQQLEPGEADHWEGLKGYHRQEVEKTHAASEDLKAALEALLVLIEEPPRSDS